MTVRWQLAVVAIAACGAPARPAPHALSARAPTGTPDALLDGASDRLRARARVARAGDIRFEPNGAAFTAEVGDDPQGEVLPVGDQSASRVQLLVEGDDARVLLWIDRKDLATVVIRAQALLDPVTRERGAVARPGAVPRVMSSTRDDLMDVTVEDGGVIARGLLPRAALGTVYEPRHPHGTNDLSIAPGTHILARPTSGAREIAETTEDVGAHALAPAAAGWQELEIDGDALYVRGWAPASQATPGPAGLTGMGTGAAFGMSDTATLILPSGACLYAREGGPIIGVNTAERLRYARDADAPGWRRVAVSTPWGLLWPAVHFPEAHGAPAGDFDRCATRPSAAP